MQRRGTRQRGHHPPAKRADRTGRQALGLLVPHRGRLAVVAVSILVSACLGICTPFLTAAVFDRALFAEGGPDIPLLYLLVGAIIGVTLASAALGVWQTYHSTVLGNQVMQELRDKLFVHLQSMHLGFFAANKNGAIQSRLSNDVGAVQAIVIDAAPNTLFNFVTVVASLAGMFALSWQLTLVALGLAPFSIYLQIRMARRRRGVASSTQASLSDMSVISQEALSISGILLAKVYGRQEFESERYRRENARQAQLQVRQEMMGQSFQVLVQVSFGVTPAVIYLLTGHLDAGSAGSLSAGTLVAFTTLQARLLFPMVNLMRTALDFTTSLAAFERVFEYLDLVPEIVDAPDAVKLTPGEDAGSIRVDEVFFRYDTRAEAGSDRIVGPVGDDDRSWTLANVSLEVKPGQLAALVGPSGSGKTTLTYLIPRLFDATRGKIELDGHDIRQVSQQSLAEAIGMVTQETYLFHGTIRDNLRYANHRATDSEVRAAARAANIHELIDSFPEGYDTVVGERGYRLSGGEKQRLSIARVILKNPRFLILDEATSALDSANEKLVQDALSKVMHGRTTLAIAHRLSTVMAANVIFVMDRGRVVERGKHRELLARRGLYAALYRHQFAGAGRPGHISGVDRPRTDAADDKVR